MNDSIKTLTMSGTQLKTLFGIENVLLANDIENIDKIHGATTVGAYAEYSSHTEKSRIL